MEIEMNNRDPIATLIYVLLVIALFVVLMRMMGVVL